jgi:hypothetical protein
MALRQKSCLKRELSHTSYAKGRNDFGNLMRVTMSSCDVNLQPLFHLRGVFCHANTVRPLQHIYSQILERA